ncbi:MAG: glycoside hydrolase family 28 protein [Pseudomonadota bacterium]
MNSMRRALLLASITSAAFPAIAQAVAADSWAMADAIRARVRAPIFPARRFPITDYGAVGDGAKDCTDAFRQAIAACNAAGGGRVVAPRGEWATGAIHLKSNVELHLEDGAAIRFSRDPAAYLPLVYTRWEGVECMNYSPFIYAFEQDNIAITGSGVIDGRSSAEYWWPWKGRADIGWREGMPKQDSARTRLFQMGDDNVPVAQRRFGEGSYLRPQFIQPYRCRNVLIEGVTLMGSPMWQVHPVLCQNVTVRGLTIDGGGGPNTDGCDPESCTDVLIENCIFNTGDDCIAIKAGRNGDGRRTATPSQNIVIRNCQMRDGHGALTVGSEISGGVRYVFAENCQMSSPHLDHAIRIKNNAMRGGDLEHLYFRDLRIGQVSHAVVTVDFNYEEGASGAFTPILRDLVAERIASGSSPHAVDLQGLPNAPATDILIKDCDFSGVTGENIIRNVQNLRFDHVRVNGRMIAPN